MNKLFLLFTVFAFSLNAQNTNLTWDFPVKPGSDTWQSFTSGKQMLDACQIPQEILSTLSTENLAEICLNYPLRIEYLAFNDPKIGIEVMIRNFNGLTELSNRTNAAEVLMRIYEEYPVYSQPGTGGNKVYDLPFLEMLLSDDAFIRKLDNTELSVLESAVLDKYERKLQNSEVYSLYNIKSTLLIGAVAKYKQTGSIDTRSLSKRETLKEFIDNFSTASPELLTEVSKIISNL